MWDLLANTGFFGFILCAIGTIIFAIKRNRLWKKCLAWVGVSFVLFVIGVLNFPPDPDKVKQELAASQLAFNQGQSALEAKRYEEALAAFQQVVEEDTKNYHAAQSKIKELSHQVVQTKLERAIVLYEQENYKEARSLLEQVVEIDPNIAQAQLYYGLVNLYPFVASMSGYEQVNQAIGSSTILSYGDLVSREESIGKNEALHKQAREYIEVMQDAVDSSKKNVTKATEIDPTYKEALQTTEVLQTLEQLLAKMDQYHKTYIQIADKYQSILTVEKKWKKTWDSGDFEKLDEIDPDIRQEYQELQQDIESMKAEAATFSEEISALQKQGQDKMKELKTLFPKL
ncbi:tetratricopeptide repeat protein [Brevibacillus sp. AG162]|uniref:tetratricopeptide repeat protein n=1 Tax=Brevibacillus sp. AG162 TaxID=2572910 RepID=UPI00115204DB|nr:tetratricopeptide repeat protein [Brevibacillus sp. AG162]TQK53295.1 tetratricopeptide repeat protein [Brevibacillus sp. AG162]